MCDLWCSSLSLCLCLSLSLPFPFSFLSFDLRNKVSREKHTPPHHSSTPGMAHHHHENVILIHTDRGAYISGDTIFGHILLHISHPVPAKALCFEIKGYEKTHWTETRSEAYQDGNETKWREVTDEYHASKDFFKDHYSIIDHPGGFPAGSFSYPFQYRLPDTLPGVFSKKKKKKHGDKFKAKIAYKIKAVLENHKHDLIVKQHLVVYSKLDGPIVPKHHNKTAEVRTLCCIPRGPVSVEAWVDKSCYVSGETAQIHVSVQNNSTVPVNHFNSKLIREMTINNGRGRTKRLCKVMSEARYEGCPPGESRSRAVPLLLKSKRNNYLKPSTKSGLVECKYHVLIEMDIPWAPDIEIPSPVTLYMPLSPSWTNWAPPAWANHCITQSVHPSLAVPEHILRERVQNGFFVAPHAPLPFEMAVSAPPSAGKHLGNERTPLLSG